VVHVPIPPLRDRISDLPALARHLLSRIADPETFTVDRLTSSRRKYRPRMRRGDLFGVAVRTLRSPNLQKAICLISVHK
jgi:transcriptional regulator of aromatic amino acid metabolism